MARGHALEILVADFRLIAFGIGEAGDAVRCRFITVRPIFRAGFFVFVCANDTFAAETCRKILDSGAVLVVAAGCAGVGGRITLSGLCYGAIIVDRTLHATPFRTCGETIDPQAMLVRGAGHAGACDAIALS